MKSVLTNHSMAYMFSGSQKASSFVKHLKKRASFFEKLASFLHTVVNEKASSLWKLARFLVKWSPGPTPKSLLAPEFWLILSPRPGQRAAWVLTSQVEAGPIFSGHWIPYVFFQDKSRYNRICTLSGLFQTCQAPGLADEVDRLLNSAISVAI